MYYLVGIFWILFLVKSFTFSKLHKISTLLEVSKNSAGFIFLLFLQQIGLFFVWSIFKIYLADLYLILIMGALFALLHVRLFFVYRKLDGYILTISSFFGGILFVFLYSQYYLWGLAIAFLIHIGFHILLDILYILFGGKPIKYYKNKNQE